MKTRLILTVTVGSLLLAVGCGKKQEPTPPTQSSDLTAPSAAQKVADTAQAQTQVVKDTVQNAATNVQAQVQTQAADVTAKVQGVIDQAKKLMGENKLTEALASLNSLSGQQLTTDQQSLVESLKAQIQKALDATKAAGGLLQPKQ